MRGSRSYYRGRPASLRSTSDARGPWVADGCILTVWSGKAKSTIHLHPGWPSSWPPAWHEPMSWGHPDLWPHPVADGLLTPG